MKFNIQKVKLWFGEDNANSETYNFFPDKVNVITGDPTRGKTSIWSIIDYCLLSKEKRIADRIIPMVSWFGINVIIGETEISIARKSPKNGEVSSEIYFTYGALPSVPSQNNDITEVRAILNKLFGITDELKLSLDKGISRDSQNISFRHFLILNSITANYISHTNLYFDTSFYGKDEYDKLLRSIIHLAIGICNLQSIKLIRKIEETKKEISKIISQKNSNTNEEVKFEKNINSLINKLKENGLLDYSYDGDISEKLEVVDEVISNTRKVADNTKAFAEIDDLNKVRENIVLQINAIERYKKEYDAYKKNLSKSEDSLKPIEFLKKNLSDQLVDSLETRVFIDTLEESLRTIQNSLSKKVAEPLKVSGDSKELRSQLKSVENQIAKLNPLKNNLYAEAKKFVVIGEITKEKEFYLNARLKGIKPIDNERLIYLNKEAEKLNMQNSRDVEQVRFSMIKALNECIQRWFNLIKSMPDYQNSEARYDDAELGLKLYPDGQLFPYDTVGSQSNYMFMHLCFYLGLHEHMISIKQNHVPQFLFIDQPSLPYSPDKRDSFESAGKTKLLDAFSLLNSFIEYIKEQNNSFQILLVEQAPKEFWTENGLNNFHTVAEFINGNGLIPKEIYNTK